MNAGTSGPSPGARLRAAREARGLSIEDVAERLRLNAALVLAMEEDRLALLGAPVFARGHLRNYAVLVGAPLAPRVVQWMRGWRSPGRIFVVLAFLLALADLAGAHWPGVAREAAVHLAQATQAVARGDFSRRAPVTSRDELGVLTESFNTMTAQLAEQYTLAANANDALVIPAGLAFAKASAKRGDVRHGPGRLRVLHDVVVRRSGGEAGRDRDRVIDQRGAVG